jgi:hypothetical protein
MAKQKKNNPHIEVVVLWGGSELGRCQKPLSKCSGISAGKSFLSTIRSRVWPRWDEIDILIKSRSGLVLNPNLPWDGVIKDSDGVHVLSSTKPQRKIVGISNISSASLRLDEMSILIRVGERRAPKVERAKKKRGYLASPLSFVATGGSEWVSLTLAAVGAAIIIGSIWFGLANRPRDSFDQITELPDSRILPFIGQSHLSSAPNILQTNLDRFNFVHSVWRFYSDLAVILGYGDDPGKSAQTFSSTIEYYQDLAEAQQKIIGAAESAQVKKLASSSNRGHFITVPTVRGESLDGRAMRIFDKISILRDASDGLAQRRIEVAEQFAADVGYKFEPKKDENKTQQAFAKISAGFMGVESDDKMQIRQATENAARAALVQTQIYGKDHLRFGLLDCCGSPAGAPLTQDGLTWLKPELDQADQSSFSEFGARSWGNAVAPGEKISQASATKTGGLSPTIIERTVAAGRYQIRMCYELALRRNQLARGSMEWRWVINSQGRASELNLIKSSIKDDDMVKCVRDKIASWKFPSPDGGSVEVRYPFEFTRDKG